MTEKQRDIWFFVFNITMSLGAIAGLLAFLGIKPGDLRAKPPHTVWLIGSLLLFAITLWSSLRASFFLKRQINLLKRARDLAVNSTIVQAEIEKRFAQEAHQEEIRKLETAHKAELYRANEARRQCEEERRAAISKSDEINTRLSIFAPLQLEAVELSDALLSLLKRLGPPPEPKFTREQIDGMSAAETKRLIEAEDGDFAEACEYYFGDGHFQPRTADGLLNSMMARMYRLWPFYEKVKASYELELAPKVREIWNRFTVEELADDRLILPVDGRDGIKNIKTIAATLWELSYKLSEKTVPSGAG
jgi:hypothetical protein